MGEILNISFNIKPEFFENEFKNYDKTHYQGKLQKGIDSGKYIWLYKQHLISKKYLEDQERWLNNFGELCSIKSLEENELLKGIRESLEKRERFPRFNKLFELGEKLKIDIDPIHRFYANIYKQPIEYFFALQVHNTDLSPTEKIIKRYNAMHYFNQLSKDKFNIWIVSFRCSLLNLIESENKDIQTVLRDLIFIGEEMLTNKISLKNMYSFNYVESPLFIFFMEFVKDLYDYYSFIRPIKILPKTKEFFNDIDKYRNPFIIEFLPQQEIKKVFISLPEMFEKVPILEKICELLVQKDFAYYNNEGKLIWKGNPLNPKGKKTQLVALSLCCDKYFKEAYSGHDIHKAFTSYFNFKISATPFKDGQVGDAVIYKKYFSFIESV